MVRKGTENDIDSWMRLVRLVSPVFPGLETEDAIAEHRETVFKFMRRGEALCSYDGSEIAGVLLYSKKHSMICCLAVAPEYRRQGIASELLIAALNDLDRTEDISVSTYREGDEKGFAARLLYGKFGFVPEELIEEFGYPNQVFRLHP